MLKGNIAVNVTIELIFRENLLIHNTKTGVTIVSYLLMNSCYNYFYQFVDESGEV